MSFKHSSLRVKVVIEERGQDVTADGLVCFCLPLETYHIRLSSTTIITICQVSRAGSNNSIGLPSGSSTWICVNDKVGNTPVAVTYCPLCFTNQVFSPTMNDGRTLEFGTSGKLYNSNLVMYDRTTKSLWSQAMSQAIVGKFAGIKLERVPFDVAYWKEWKQLIPESKVLSKDTGSSRPYGADPYGDTVTF